MAASNINRVILTGNLTRDPEVRHTGGGMAICALRIANNTRRKQGEEWVDYANFFDVKIFGRQGENAAQYLSKGRPVAVDGRLEWREYQDNQGNKRQAIEVIADNIQFLGGRDEGTPNGNGSANGGGFAPRSDVPADTSDFAGAPAGGTAAPPDDDIPF